MSDYIGSQSSQLISSSQRSKSIFDDSIDDDDECIDLTSYDDVDDDHNNNNNDDDNNDNDNDDDDNLMDEDEDEPTINNDNLPDVFSNRDAIKNLRAKIFNESKIKELLLAILNHTFAEPRGHNLYQWKQVVTTVMKSL